jgi:hypothetical protein
VATTSTAVDTRSHGARDALGCSIDEYRFE